MSMLIKSNDKAHGFTIQKIGAAAAVPITTNRATSANIENPLMAENRRLLALLDRREAEIAAHSDALANAYAAGEGAGRVAMEADIEDDRTASLTLLSQGIEAAKTGLGYALENAESMALMVSKMALEKMFGETESRKAAAADLIRHQFRQICYESFVSLEVSRVDFPNTSEVAELLATLSIAPHMVRVSDELGAGDCRMRLQLGTVDIGLAQQWGSIRALLEDMVVTGEVEEVE